MAETELNCFAASEVLFSTSSRNKRHGNANVFKKGKKRFLEEALGLCAVANKRERKERSG